VRTIRLTLEYDGTGLGGWQRQDNAPTVQQHLEEALAAMVGAPTPVIGASRTDAGVHALGQVAHFQTESTIPLHGFRQGLTSALPDPIAVIDAGEAGPDFHARFSARGKHYRYTLLNRRDPSPLLRHTTWWRARPLDLDAMRRAAAPLLGEHDYAAFRAAGCTARTTTRNLSRIDLTRAGDLVHIDVEGNAFLRHMVRILAGTLVEVGEARRDPTTIPTLLASADRTQAGPTAPAHGLTLLEVYYPGGTLSRDPRD
jgi:tRNA pseudouridine38-40 synthase